MKKIIEYKSVENDILQELVSDVNCNIQNSWELYGNLIVNTLNTNETSYIQMMVLVEKKE